MKKIIILLFLSQVANAFCNNIISINSKHFFIDSNKKLIVSNINIDSLNKTSEDSIDYFLLDNLFELSSPISKLDIGVGYNLYLLPDSTIYTLYFTQLPLISISIDKKIVNEPNRLANIKFIETDSLPIESKIGIQLRGATSQSYPKKSYEFEFWEDSIGNETKDYKLLGMTTSDKWNLQAMYNEPLRIRSKTNNDLWRKISTLYYQDVETEAINGIHMKYVELFLNGEYQGVYCLGEKVNRKQLKLKKYKDNVIRGELYKAVSWGSSYIDSFTGSSVWGSATMFNNVNIPTKGSLTWLGLEYKHPDEKIDWTNMEELVNFVINSSDEEFYDKYYGYQSKFDINNLVDYYIFINLLRATDNTGKNVYIAKYDTDGYYFYVPWDLDGSYGTIYNGTRANITNDLLFTTNGLFNRLVNDNSVGGFNDKVKTKWLSLRSTVISNDSLMSMFNENYNYLAENGVYNREKMLWNGINDLKTNALTEYTYSEDELTYMSSWIDNRLTFLNENFSKYTETLVERHILNESKINIYPNPTKDFIHLNFNSIDFDEYQISIYNTAGQLVLSQVCNESNNTISLQDFEKGVFIIKIENNDDSNLQKIILM